MYGRCSYSSLGAQRRLDLPLGERLVVAGDVAVAELGEHVVAALHLLDRPAERVGGLLRVGDRLREQVREPGVLAHFDLLGVDQDEAHVVRGRAHQQRGDDAVDAARLAGTGGTGDQHVRGGGEVEEHGLAGDVLADRHVERVGGLGRFGGCEEVAQRNELALMVRHLDADRRAAGDRRQDAHVDGRHCVGDVLLQAGDPGDLDAGAEFEFVAGHGRADRHAEQGGLDAVRGERFVQHLAAGLDGLAIDRLLAGPVEERHRRQHPLAHRRTVADDPSGGLASRVELRLLRPARLRRRQGTPAEVVTFGIEVVQPRRQRGRLAGDSEFAE